MEKINVNVYNKGKNELPTYSTPLSAGFDLKANLGDKDTKYLGNQKWKVFDDGHIMLYNGGRILIPTGLHVAIPDGNRMLLQKGGIAFPHPFPEHYSRLSKWFQDHSASPRTQTTQLGLF